MISGISNYRDEEVFLLARTFLPFLNQARFGAGRRQASIWTSSGCACASPNFIHLFISDKLSTLNKYSDGAFGTRCRTIAIADGSNTKSSFRKGGPTEFSISFPQPFGILRFDASNHRSSKFSGTENEGLRSDAWSCCVSPQTGSQLPFAQELRRPT